MLWHGNESPFSTASGWNSVLSDPEFALLCVICRYSHRQRSYRHVPAEAHGLQRGSSRPEEPQSSSSCSPGHLRVNHPGLSWAVLYQRQLSCAAAGKRRACIRERTHVRVLFRWQSALYLHSISLVNRRHRCRLSRMTPVASTNTFSIVFLVSLVYKESIDCNTFSHLLSSYRI